MLIPQRAVVKKKKKWQTWKLSISGFLLTTKSPCLLSLLWSYLLGGRASHALSPPEIWGRVLFYHKPSSCSYTLQWWKQISEHFLLLFFLFLKKCSDGLPSTQSEEAWQAREEVNRSKGKRSQQTTEADSRAPASQLNSEITALNALNTKVSLGSQQNKKQQRKSRLTWEKKKWV